MITVIADDITGAAEIAGIGWHFGLDVTFIVFTKHQLIDLPKQAELLIIATDTRSMNEVEACEETTLLARAIKETGCTAVFKKTDSALRGHIIAELRQLMEVFEKKNARLLPQNPSRGRTIRNGLYFIDDTPLHLTPFSHDPEFPAKISEVAYLLHIKSAQILPIGKSTDHEGVFLLEATHPEEVLQYAYELEDTMIPAGGADFFTAYLTTKGYTKKEKTSFGGLKNNGIFILLGSTAKHLIFEMDYIRNNQIPAYGTPSILLYAQASQKWTKRVINKYAERNSLILHTHHLPRKGKRCALNLKEEMAKTVEALYAEHRPQELIIEGGATAFAVLKRLGWFMFDVQCEVSPGVIRLVPLTHPEITVTLKPGSYPWGDLFR